MKNTCFLRYYRVFKNDTAVTEISTNDFKPTRINHFKRGLPVSNLTDTACSFPYFQYSLVPDEQMFYGYLDKLQAISKAKAGAQAYINQLTKAITAGISKLEKYREDHYEDLNFNLIDTDIYRLKKQLHLK